MREKSGGRVRIREVRRERDRAVAAAYSLMRRTFPTSELTPKRDWLESMRERDLGLWLDLNWHLLVAEQRNRIVGAATGFYLGGANVGLVGYIATHRSLRSRRVGTRLRDRLLAALKRDARRIRGRPLSAVVGEVHRESPWLAHLVRCERAIALDFPYYQPPIPGRGPPVPFILYYQPLSLRRTSLPAAQVRRLVFALWRRPYRVARPLAHPVFRRMLRALQRKGRVGPARV